MPLGEILFSAKFSHKSPHAPIKGREINPEAGCENDRDADD
jgi:hypothetical protein